MGRRVDARQYHMRKHLGDLRDAVSLVDAAAAQTGGHLPKARAQATGIDERCGRTFATIYGDWNYRLRLWSTELSIWHKHSHMDAIRAQQHLVHSSDAHRMHTHIQHPAKLPS